MTAHDTIPFLSGLWWTATGLTVVGIVVICVLPRCVRRVPQQTWFNLLAVALGANWILGHLPFMLDGSWKPATHMPLHLCGMTSLLAVVILVRPHQLGTELLYYFGVAGGIQALITPEFTNGIDPIALPQYYVAHASMIVVPLMVMRVRGCWPRPRSWLYAFAIIQPVMLFVGTFDYLSGGNYMYLARPPEAANPLIFGPWPWYILGFEVVGFLHLLLLGLPFMRTPRQADLPVGETLADATAGD